MLGFCLFHSKLKSLETIPFFIFIFIFSGFLVGQGEAQINNIVRGVTAFNHVPYLRHMDIFMPNAVNHPFSHFKSWPEVSWDYRGNSYLSITSSSRFCFWFAAFSLQQRLLSKGLFSKLGFPSILNFWDHSSFDVSQSQLDPQILPYNLSVGGVDGGVT